MTLQLIRPAAWTFDSVLHTSDSLLNPSPPIMLDPELELELPPTALNADWHADALRQVLQPNPPQPSSHEQF